MNFSQSILRSLEQRFLIGFKVTNYQSEDQFSITFSGEEASSVVMDLLIKSDSRLKLKFRMGNYAANIIHTIQTAEQSRKKLFVGIWNQIMEEPCCNLCVKVNQKDLSQDDFLSSGILYGAFSLEFEAFPFYDPDDDNRLSVVSGFVGQLWTMILAVIPYTIEGEKEGTEYEKTITTHERNPINRQLCLQLKGYACAVCGMKFEDVYGQIGKEFIEIHHTNPVSEMGDSHAVDIVEELVPLCSNCHSMIHRRRPPYSVEELKSLIQNKGH